MFRKLLKNAEGKISWTKISGAIFATAAIIVTLPASGVVVPLSILTAAKIIGAVAVATGVAGARDALDKK